MLECSFSKLCEVEFVHSLVCLISWTERFCRTRVTVFSKQGLEDEVPEHGRLLSNKQARMDVWIDGWVDEKHIYISVLF